MPSNAAQSPRPFLVTSRLASSYNRGCTPQHPVSSVSKCATIRYLRYAQRPIVYLQMHRSNDRLGHGPRPARDAANTQTAKSSAHHVRKQPRKRDRSGENFKKRWHTLVKTLSELHYDYGAEFHISMSRKRQDYVCRSRKGISPLQADDIVRTPPLLLPSLLII